MVFYLKYRPQTIYELDSEKVRDTLYQVLSLPQIPHAFLFTGPKGLGKTSAARILAKAVNCEQSAKGIEHRAKGKVQKTKTTLSSKPLTLSQSNEPCNECEQCISITNGTNLDVLEIDAASNRGIDEIRDLREKIKLSPIKAEMKVYIIDEVHMLTNEAFNALLKTLEEPPNHAMFILCTTELLKVPETIQSRCFQIKFSRATKDDITRSFQRIIAQEKLEISEEAIYEIFKLADGGYRDAHKLLEELVAIGERKITVDLVEKRYKVVSIKYQIDKMIKSCEKRDLKSGINLISEIINSGIDIKQFTLQLTETVHDMLLIKAGVNNNSEFKIQNSELSINELRELLVLLNKALQEMKYALLSQLPLELAIIDFCQADMQKAVSEKEEGDLGFKKQDAGEKNNLQKSVTATVAVDNSITVAKMRKQVGDMVRVKVLYGEKKEDKAVENRTQVSNFSLLNISNEEITQAWIDNFWQVYIMEIKQYNHTIAGVLRSCQIRTFDKERLVIETAYKFHKEKLSEGKTREILENVCKTLTGSMVRVEIVLNNK